MDKAVGCILNDEAARNPGGAAVTWRNNNEKVIIISICLHVRARAYRL
jgi:hypothetical protein